jgi:hypothetical protein
VRGRRGEARTERQAEIAIDREIFHFKKPCLENNSCKLQLIQHKKSAKVLFL